MDVSERGFDQLEILERVTDVDITVLGVCCAKGLFCSRFREWGKNKML